LGDHGNNLGNQTKVPSGTVDSVGFPTWITDAAPAGSL